MTTGVSTSIARCGGCVVLAVRGDIDLATAPAIDKAIFAALVDIPAALIIDLSAVEFLASAGLKILVATHEKVSGSGRLAVVVANNPAAKRLIELTGLDQVLSLYPTLKDAVTSLQDAIP